MRAGYGILAACAAIALTLAGTPARAAGGAFAIDDAGVDDPGACKVEAFASAANNLPSDRVGVVSPACVVGLLNHRADLSAAIARSRNGGEYASSLTFKAKTPILGLDFSKNDRFGIAVAAGYTFDLTHSGQDAAFAVVAATVRATPDLLFNFNAGYSHHHDAPQRYPVWGAGFELNLKALGAETFTILGEVFAADRSNTATQFGLQFMPTPKIDLDLIFGHNLNGEDTSWITLGVNFRF